MDFARKQLEKYGWTAGKGLGKNENGISEALKPKLKRSVTGVGHDLAQDFTEHWWNDLYNKAAKNVEVEEVNGKVKKIKRKEATFEITNKTWQIKKKRKGESSEEQYTDYFVKTAILSSGASKTENIYRSESEDEQPAEDIFKMTDEDLFAACEGRTAHKGARHGLKALGKLARIEQQEQLLLNQEKYNGYSVKSKQNTKKEITINDSEENSHKCSDTDQVVPKKEKKKSCHDKICSGNLTADFIKQLNGNSESKILRKKKKDKKKDNSNISLESDINEEVDDYIQKKKKRDKDIVTSCENNATDVQENTENEMSDLKRRRKDKRKHDMESSAESNLLSNISIEIENNISKKKKARDFKCTTSEENIVEIQKDSDILIKKHKKKKRKNNM